MKRYIARIPAEAAVSVLDNSLDHKLLLTDCWRWHTAPGLLPAPLFAQCLAAGPQELK
jgi:hypothetical protein